MRPSVAPSGASCRREVLRAGDVDRSDPQVPRGPANPSRIHDRCRAGRCYRSLMGQSPSIRSSFLARTRAWRRRRRARGRRCGEGWGAWLGLSGGWPEARPLSTSPCCGSPRARSSQAQRTVSGPGTPGGHHGKAGAGMGVRIAALPQRVRPERLRTSLQGFPGNGFAGNEAHVLPRRGGHGAAWTARANPNAPGAK